AGTQWAGRRGLARPHQGALWHPRHGRAADYRPGGIQRLHPPGELGRPQALADDEAGLHGGLPGLMLKAVGAAIVTAVLVSAFWIFWYNIRNAPEVTLAGRK